MKSKKIIVIFCHSRALLLDKCLSSVKKARGVGHWELVVIHQIGNKEVEKVLYKHKAIIHTVVSTKPEFREPLGNINYNRILGTKYAFELLNAEFVLGIEEDNLISKDSLLFIESIYESYKHDKAFRGINLGSVEHDKNISKAGYSLLRFGLHGSAGVLTRRTWNYIKKHRLWEFDLNNLCLPWDAQIEFYLKSGYMVTPNITRNLDLGYDGTFAPSAKDKYFISIKKSWHNNIYSEDIIFERIQVKHNWRSDAVAYRKRHSIFYILRRQHIFSELTKFLFLKKIISRVLIK